MTGVLIAKVFSAAFPAAPRQTFLLSGVSPCDCPWAVVAWVRSVPRLTGPARTSVTGLNASRGHRQVWVPSDNLACRAPLDGGPVFVGTLQKKSTVATV